MTTRLPRLLPPWAITDLAAATPAGPPSPAGQLIYWGLVDWEYPRQRPQHLASELSHHFRTLYVRPAALSRLLRAPRRQWPPAVAWLSASLALLRPRALSPGRLAAVARVNDQRVTALVRQQLTPEGPIILWLSHPDQASQIGQYSEALVCFDSMDYHAAFKPWARRATMAAAELSLLRRADLVFTSSHDLQARATAVGAQAVLVPNAVEFARFATAATQELAAPADIAALPGPRLLFYGTLGPWVDIAFIARLAQARPDWTVLVLGTPAGADLAPLAGLTNLHHLGRRPYETLPAYLQHVEACLLPFVGGDLTRAVDPVKLYEYLAAGKPVIATPLPELAKCGDLVEVVASPAAAVAAIERLLASPETDDRRRQRLAFAADHTWRGRAATIVAALDAALAGRSSGSRSRPGDRRPRT